jgi:TolB-like protein/lipoprotein NlpI
VNPKNFFAELKRRNVYKVAIAYALVGWLLIQIATQVFPFFEIPNWGVRLMVLIIALGFPIALILAWAFELTPEGVKRTETVESEGRTARSRGRAWIYVVIVAGVLSAGLFFLGSHSNKQGAAGEAPAKSIAVLPFENLSHDPDNTYFAEGIKDELLARLSKVADLKVISIRSIEQLKSSPDDLTQIARKFGVANILAGSVQRSTDQVRVSVQLVKGESNAHLWADTFDRKMTDIFAIESDVAKIIAEKLQAKLTGSEESAIFAKPTENVEAHQLYLQGRYFWNRRTGENLKKALSYFQQAVEKDPGYALAYAGISDSCTLIPVYGAGTPKDYYPRAKVAAEKALQLDSMLGEAHASLANVLFRYFKLAESTREFERSIELNPNYPTAHQWYGRLMLLMLGQFDRAIAEVKRAVELDPVSPIIHADLGTIYTFARRYDEAIEQFRHTLELDPQFYWGHRQLGLALELKGSTVEAIAEYQKALQLSDDPRVLAFIGHAEASTGRQNEARAILAKLTEMAKTRYVSGYSFAAIHLALGEKDQALDGLEKDARERNGFEINFVKVDPYLDPLRSDPRFEALVSSVLSGSVK